MNFIRCVECGSRTLSCSAQLRPLARLLPPVARSNGAWSPLELRARICSRVREPTRLVDHKFPYAARTEACDCERRRFRPGSADSRSNGSWPLGSRAALAQQEIARVKSACSNQRVQLPRCHNERNGRVAIVARNGWLGRIMRIVEWRAPRSPSPPSPVPFPGLNEIGRRLAILGRSFPARPSTSLPPPWEIEITFRHRAPLALVM